MKPLLIRINEPFSEQYTLEIESSLMAVNAIMNSRSQMRWDVNIVTVKEEFIELRLILLEHILLESNNPLIKELANLTATFCKMYNELHLIIDHKGKIFKVINQAGILSKWQKTKSELEKIANDSPEIKNIIVLNDSIFTNTENLVATLQRSEFFMMYFNAVFGNRLPFADTRLLMPNFLNTTNLNWNKNVEVNDVTDSIAEIGINTTPLFLQADFNERAYGQFKEQLNINKLIPEISEKGKWTVDAATGKVLKSELIRNETADADQLYSKLVYSFTSDTVKNAAIQKPINQYEAETA